MARDEVARTPSEVFARRVREAREDRKWSQQRLADELARDRTTIVKLESGAARTRISIDDLFDYADVLGIPPLDLMTPLGDNDPIEVAGKVRPAHIVRDWIVGRGRLRGRKPAPKEYLFRQMPRQRLRALVDVALTPPPGQRLEWLARGLGEKHERLVEDVVDLLRNLPVKEEDDG